MYFKLNNFAGIAPGVDDRRLSDQFGTVASDIDFESGALVPITDNSVNTTLSNSNRRSVFRYKTGNTSYWLQWNEEVDVVKGPIPNDAFDRLYWTGEDYPRVGIGSTSNSMISGSGSYPATSFKLGIPAPSTAPTTNKTGTADSTQTPFDVSYVFTFVSAIGEEGPPSPPSTVIELTDAENVVVTMGATPSGNYNFSSGALRRIYRSNTGSNNTRFQFVGEVPIATTTFTDTKNGSELGELLPSETWIGPPDDDTNLYPSGPMIGLIAVANGIMAGFTGNRLCFSEPFLPHAWPVSYRITLESDIVAIGATGNGVVALTEGDPYFVTGTDPSAMSAIKLDIQQSCVNKNSVVDMGGYLLYAGPDGLVAAGGNEARLVTQGLISAKQWNASFAPTTIRAFRHENTYVAFNTTVTSTTPPVTLSTGWVYDPRAQESALSTLALGNTANVRGGFEKDDDGELYIIVGNELQEYRNGTTKKTMRFRSKKFVTPQPTSFSWVSVDAEGYPVSVRVIADDTTIASYTLSKSGNVFTQATTIPSGIADVSLQEPIMRLPADVGREWQIEVSGAVTVNEVCIAQSIDEVKVL